MFNFDEVVIDRVYRAHKYDFDGRRVWTSTQVKDPTLELGGETVYSTDAVGVNIMAFDRSKTAAFSFSNALMHLGVLASQRGVEKQVASSDKKIVMTCIEPLEVTVAAEGASTVTLTHTPYAEVEGVPFKYIDKVSRSFVTEKTIELGETAETNFSVSGKVITLPTGITWTKGDLIMVKYKYETDSGMAIDDNGEVFAQPGEFVIEAFCYNPCEKGVKKLLNIIFPNAKEDNNISLTMTNELSHPVTINAMQDYCSTDKKLFRIEAAS